MMADSNAVMVQGIYDAIGRGDVPAVLGALDPEVDWNEMEGFPYAGQYVGPDAVLNGVIARLGAEWDGFSVVPDQVLDAGEHVVGLGWYSGTYKATGKAFRARFAHVWTLRDGKVIHFQQYADTAKVQEALVR
jgi:ketosteroid isomerase-like protein